VRDRRARAAVRLGAAVEMPPRSGTVPLDINPYGLKDNLLQFLDVEMDKTTRHSDWSAPVLSADQVRYAISDVTLLLPLKDKLEESLGREGRKGLAEACFKVIPLFAELDILGYVNLFEH
jgi:ribonuclease D